MQQFIQIEFVISNVYLQIQVKTGKQCVFFGKSKSKSKATIKVEAEEKIKFPQDHTVA